MWVVYAEEVNITKRIIKLFDNKNDAVRDLVEQVLNDIWHEPNWSTEEKERETKNAIVEMINKNSYWTDGFAAYYTLKEIPEYNKPIQL